MNLCTLLPRWLIPAACLFALVGCDPPTVATPGGGTSTGGTFSLTYTYPHDKAVGVPADTPIVVIFAVDVDPATLEPNIVITKGKSTSVKGTVTYDAPDYQATVVAPESQWDAATEYKVTLKTGIKSKGGADTLDKEYTFGFTTK
jgi:hypothetical protein